MNIFGSLWISSAKSSAFGRVVYFDTGESVGSSPAPEVFFEVYNQPVSKQRALLCGCPDSWHSWPAMGDTRHFEFYDRPWTRLRRGASYENLLRVMQLDRHGHSAASGQNLKKKMLWPAPHFSVFCHLGYLISIFFNLNPWSKKTGHGLLNNLIRFTD